MANSGFSLVIPETMLNRLNKANEKIEQLAKTSEATQTRVVNAFTSMAIDGVDKFIQKLNEAKLALTTMGSNVVINVQSDDNALLKSIASINSLAQALEHLKQISEKAQATNVTNTAVSIADGASKMAKSALKELRKEVNAVNRAMKSMEKEEQRYADAVTNMSRNIDEMRRKIEEYNRQLREQAKLNAQSSQNFNPQTMSLNELKQKAKELRAIMDNLDPKSKEWQELNNKLQETNKEIKSINQEMRGVQQASHNAKGALEGLGRLASSVFSAQAITNYVRKLIEVRGEFELQQRSLQALLQNRTEADILWDKTVRLAVNSPFKVGDLVKYTKQLAAYRVESDKLYDTTKMLADISSGLGVDMNRLILAYGQVKAANYLRGTELRQFSEAGINIIEELSNYFEELEGRAVSTGEVFERVSKRMVLFEDVDAVLKKVTREGGIFFDMQAEQAETLRGVWMNLQDSVDLMLDEIGRANSGVLKGALAITKDLLENWKYLKIAIMSATSALIAYNAAMIKTNEAGVAMRGITLVFSKIGGAFTKLFTTAGGWTAIVAAIVTALGVWYSDLRKVQREQDEYNARLNLMGDATKKYADNILGLTKKIEELNEANKHLDENSEEYKRNQDDISQIEEERKKLLKDLSILDDSYAKLLASNTATTEELTKQSDAYNESLRERLSLMKMLGDKEKTQNKLENTSSKKTQAEEKLFESFYRVNDFIATMSQDLYFLTYASEESKKAVENFLTSTEDFPTRLTKVYEAFKQDIGKSWINQFTSLGVNRQLNKYIRNAQKAGEATNDFKQEAEGLFNEVANNPGKYDNFVGEALNTWFSEAEVSQDALDEAQNAIITAFNQIMDANSIAGEGRNIMENTLRDLFGFDSWETISMESLDGWQKAYNDYIDSLEGDKPQRAKAQTERQKLREELRKEIEDLEASIANDKKANTILSAELKQKIEKDEQMLENTKKALKFLGYHEEKKDSGGEDIFEKRLKVIKQINDAYKELKKTFSEVEAKEMALDKFTDAFMEAWGGKTPKEMGFDLFSEEGMVDAYETAERFAQDINDKIRARLAKGEYVGEVRLELKKDSDEDLKNEVNELFTQFENYTDLKELGVPKSLMNHLFNIDYTSLSSLREKIVALRDRFIGDDMIKEYEEFLKKIEALENKDRLDKAKKYIEYLNYGADERLKLKIEELRKIREIEDTFSKEELSSEKSMALEGLRKEYEGKIQSLTWKMFKSSEEYTHLFDSLDRSSSKALEGMLENIESLKSSMTDIPATELKDINDQMEKIRNTLIDRNPFDGLSKNIWDYVTSLGDVKKAEQEYIINSKRKKDADEELRHQTYALAEAEDRYRAAAEKDINSREAFELGNALAQTREDYTEATINAEKASNDFTQSVEKLNKAQAINNDLGLRLTEISKRLVALGSTTQNVTTSLENMFGVMSDGTRDATIAFKELADATGQTLTGIGTIIATNGTSGWGQAIQGIANLIGSIGSIGDRKKERKIQAEIKQLEKLEKSYERLEKASSRIYSNDSYEANYLARKNSLDAQQESIKAQIEIEKSKRKSDEERIQQLRDEYEALEELEKDLEYERREFYGGIDESDYLSTTQGFTDSMLDSIASIGSALDGLEESFDAFFDNLIKQEIAKKMVSKFAPLFDLQNKLLVDDGRLDEEDLKELATFKEKLAKEAIEDAEALAKAYGVNIGGNGELSSLAGAASGIREDQADIIASYLNSLRSVLVTHSDASKAFYDSMTTMCETMVRNPLWETLRVQAENVENIYNLLSGVRMSLDGEGSAIRVKMY